MYLSTASSRESGMLASKGRGLTLCSLLSLLFSAF